MPPLQHHPHWHEPEVAELPEDSYTAQKLKHATPEHIHLTSRRLFIGPIPEGWLKSHRRDWYKRRLNIHYSRPSRAATFSSNPREAQRRRLSGLEGPSSSALFTRSFPQPEELDDEDRGDDNGESGNGPDTGKAKVDNLAKASNRSTAKAIATPAASNPKTELPPDELAKSSESRSVYVDAPSEPDTDEDGKADRSTGLKPKLPRQTSTKSYVTASTTQEEAQRKEAGQHQEEASALQVPTGHEEEGRTSLGKRPVSLVASSHGAPSTLVPDDSLTEVTSASPLLVGANGRELQGGAAPDTSAKGILSKKKRGSQDGTDAERIDSTVERTKSHLKNLVKFDIPEDSKRAEIHLRAKAAQMTIQRASSRLRKPRVRDGLVVKMERMLVRVDIAGKEVPDDFDENGNQKIDSRIKDKWREYMVVCRECVSDNADFVLQMYKTRVIPEIEQAQTKKRAQYEIPLGRKVAKVNLYSTLDKSLVVWTPSSRGTKIYIMQARTASNAVEWYTFIRNILGWRRASELQITVPDLSINLRLRDPFRQLEVFHDAAEDVDEEDAEENILRTMEEEHAVAGNLVRRCLEMLKDTPEWNDIIDSWFKTQRIGLAWKRYDRLEWVHGANERKMYGTIAMLKSHELELRPKVHYPTTTLTRKKRKILDEPVPVEGFLIRLSSQRGTTRRLGLLFHKQLYFSTHNQFLTFSRPAKVSPPAPPRMPTSEDSNVPSAHEIAENTPATWEVDPYPLKDDKIEWLAEGSSGTPESRRQHDEEAQLEAHRKAHILQHCDGYINLCNVVKVRRAQKGATPADEHIESGSDVDFDEDVNDETTRDDGVTTDFDTDRTFEAILTNGKIIRLQAADKDRRKVWVHHLRHLAKYWRHRAAADIGLLISTRAQNLQALNIDEEEEAYIGQYAQKWEVSQSYACPELYNLCGIAECRTIHMSGILYRKPRIHAAFTRCSVILSNGTLILFKDVLRSRTGKPLKSTHAEFMGHLHLKDAYCYSGLVTEGDLLYGNKTFDSNRPGHHALPRVWLEDGWMGSDEDTGTTFVIWHGKKKGWFRSETHSKTSDRTAVEKEKKRTKLKRVAKLGSTGRSVVFRARSRQERDHWVLAIQNEIERLQQGKAEDFRIEEWKK